MNRKAVIIIGAGPARLTTPYELLTRTDLVPIVLEMSSYVGGFSRTVNDKANRMDTIRDKEEWPYVPLEPASKPRPA